ncbi:MAG: hypothetical protein KBD16_02045 [Candidatus Pacebacteria bacterium]|nr:hypothetical protein [Candidatus Paceibacterota bacterium]
MKILVRPTLGALLVSAVLAMPTGLFAYSVENVNVIEANDFVVEPAKIEIFADPGETVRRNVTIINRVAGRSEFTIALEDFVGSDDPTVAVKLLGNEISRYSFRDNIEPEVSELSLSFGEKAIIPITIRIPATAAPGGYYTSVVIAHMPQEKGGDVTGARTVSRVAQLLFVRVNGDVEESGQVKEFIVTPTTPVHVKGPLGFNILFENTGNVHLAPYGYITIKNIFGGIVSQVPIDAYYSLPQSERYREVLWKPPFLFGYYTATLELNRGYRDAEMIDTLSASFLYLPFTYIIVLLLIIALILFAKRFIGNRFEVRRKKL